MIAYFVSNSTEEPSTGGSRGKTTVEDEKAGLSRRERAKNVIFRILHAFVHRKHRTEVPLSGQE